jgi:hypothetical protein
MNNRKYFFELKTFRKSIINIIFKARFTCPYPSAIGWAILIQYLLLVKLFLTTLLTAMFSHTKAKVDAESDKIVIIYLKSFHFIIYSLL